MKNQQEQAEHDKKSYKVADEVAQQDESGPLTANKDEKSKLIDPSINGDDFKGIGMPTGAHR